MNIYLITCINQPLTGARSSSDVYRRAIFIYSIAYNYLSNSSCSHKSDLYQHSSLYSLGSNDLKRIVHRAPRDCALEDDTVWLRRQHRARALISAHNCLPPLNGDSGSIFNWMSTKRRPLATRLRSPSFSLIWCTYFIELLLSRAANFECSENYRSLSLIIHFSLPLYMRKGL